MARVAAVPRAVCVVVAAGVLSGWGCGARVDDRPAVLRTVEQGRQALLHGDAAAACGLLSPAGVTQVFMFQVDFAPEGTPIPTQLRGVPQTCLDIVRRELARDAIAYPGVFRRALAQGRLHLLSLRAGHAEVAFRVGPIFSNIDPIIKLSKGPNGWRIDDCSCVPRGY